MEARPDDGKADEYHGASAALRFEVELASLDRLERVRRGGPGEDVSGLMQAFSAILLAPPGIGILRIDETPTT